MTKAIAFDHIHLISRDPQAAATWYQEMFGGEITAVQENLKGAPQVDVRVGGMTVVISFKLDCGWGSGGAGLEFGIQDTDWPGDPAKSFELDLAGVAPSTRDALLTISLRGAVDAGHRVRILVNGQSLGELRLQGFEGREFSFALSPSLLLEGRNTVELDLAFLAKGNNISRPEVLGVTDLYVVTTTHQRRHATPGNSQP